MRLAASGAPAAVETVHMLKILTVLYNLLSFLYQFIDE
jgi:hypothetical protein